MDDPRIDTWHIHNRITLYLLDAIDESALDGIASNGGRSVKMMFAHIHSIRLTWLKEAAPALMDGLDALPGKTNADKAAITKARLRDSLTASGGTIAALLTQGFESGKIKGFKPHAIAFMGYLIAHESYHWGEIGIALTQSGHPLDAMVAYGLWEWGSR